MSDIEDIILEHIQEIEKKLTATNTNVNSLNTKIEKRFSKLEEMVDDTNKKIDANDATQKETTSEIKKTQKETTSEIKKTNAEVKKIGADMSKMENKLSTSISELNKNVTMVSDNMNKFEKMDTDMKKIKEKLEDTVKQVTQNDMRKEEKTNIFISIYSSLTQKDIDGVKKELRNLLPTLKNDANTSTDFEEIAKVLKTIEFINDKESQSLFVEKLWSFGNFITKRFAVSAKFRHITKIISKISEMEGDKK